MRILADAMRLLAVRGPHSQTQDHIACAFIYTLNTSCCGEEHALPICKHRPLEHRPLLPQGAQLALEPGHLAVDASYAIIPPVVRSKGHPTTAKTDL